MSSYICKDTDSITEKIIGAAYEVGNTLGYGFLEKVYENSLAVELKLRGLSVECQKPVKVYYKNTIVGDYIIDLLVENKIVVELKSVKILTDIHKAQLCNYLVATKKQIGLLINFGGNRVEIKRVFNDKINLSEKSVQSVTN